MIQRVKCAQKLCFVNNVLSLCHQQHLNPGGPPGPSKTAPCARNLTTSFLPKKGTADSKLRIIVYDTVHHLINYLALQR